MWELELHQWLTIVALPLIGFAIGARLTAGKLYDPNRWIRGLRGGEKEAEEEILDALAALQDEIGDLAERQEYTERVVSRKLSPPQFDNQIATPV